MFVGIDVSKNTLDAALLPKADKPGKPRHKVFANNAPGHRQLLAWLADNCWPGSQTTEPQPFMPVSKPPAPGQMLFLWFYMKPVTKSPSSILPRFTLLAGVASSAPRPTKPTPC